MVAPVPYPRAGPFPPVCVNQTPPMLFHKGPRCLRGLVLGDTKLSGRMRSTNHIIVLPKDNWFVGSEEPGVSGFACVRRKEEGIGVNVEDRASHGHP